MRINHNIPALNAHRMLNRNANVSSSVLERLSSGRKINRAADDAAGMAISEKMKAQVRGLAKAAQNTLDGISLIQTAEGAMNEVHSMLQRMRELAVQSANGTTTDDDRVAIQAEINQLTSEVNRIANGTEFNTRNVLRGNEGPNSNTTVHRMSTGTPAIITKSFSSGFIAGSEELDGNFIIVIDGKERKVALDSVNGAKKADKPQALIDSINDAIEGLGEAILVFSGSGNIEGYEIRSTSIGGDSNILIKAPDATIVKALGLELKKEPVSKPQFGKPEKDAGKAEATILFNGIPEDGSSITIGNEKVDFFDSKRGPYTGSNRSIDISNAKGKAKSIKDIIQDLADMDFQGVKPANTKGSGNERMDSNVINEEYEQGRLTLTAVDEGFKGQAIFVEGTPKEFVTNLQVGPNQGQGFRLSVGDIRASKLRISSTNPKGNTGVIGAAFISDKKGVTDGLSSQTIEYAIDVSTEDTATAAITVYDNASPSSTDERCPGCYPKQTGIYSSQSRKHRGKPNICPIPY